MIRDLRSILAAAPRLDACPRGASQTRDLHTNTLATQNLNFKLTVRNVLREIIRTKLLSHNNPLITKHSVYVDMCIYIYMYIYDYVYHV